MSTYEECPNCGRTPGHGSTFIVYECEKCGTQYCDECGGAVCPECGSDKRQEAGECHKQE